MIAKEYGNFPFKSLNSATVSYSEPGRFVNFVPQCQTCSVLCTSSSRKHGDHWGSK